MNRRSHTSRMDQVVVSKPETYIGIDYHKHYSVYHVIDGEGKDHAKGRIEHHSPQDFTSLVQRWPKSKVVFECSMNWHWLYEILEQNLAPADIILANPAKTRIIAEAQVKTRHSGQSMNLDRCLSEIGPQIITFPPLQSPPHSLRTRRSASLPCIKSMVATAASGPPFKRSAATLGR